MTEVTYDGHELPYNADAKAYTLVLEDTETFDTTKVGVTAANADYPKTEIEKDGRLVTITLTSVDGFCKGEAKIKLVSSNADLDMVTVDGTSVEVLASGETAAAATVKNIGSKAKFTLKATAADDAAKVAIGSGETLDLAVANLNADSVKTNEVNVTESTAVNGGYVVVKVTAESGAVAYYVYSTEA